MRAVLAAAFASFGLVLHGCGGAEKTCLSKQMQVMSQTISGTMEVSLDSTFNGTTLTTTVATSFTEMFDFEKFNMREETSSTQDVDMGNQTMTVSVNTTQIVNIGLKQVVSYSSVDMAGKIFKNCTIQQLPADMPDAQQLSLLMETWIKPLLAKEAVCAGNDGTHDTWQVAKDYSGPLPAIPDAPIPAGLEIKDGSMSEELEMSQDGLLHSSTTSISGELLQNSEQLGKLQLQASMSITDAKAGGPSADDLDPSQFDVDCTEAPFAVLDLDVFLRAPGLARQRLRQVLEAAKEAAAEPVTV